MRPPTNTKLARLLEEIESLGAKVAPSDGELRAYLAAVDAVRKVYKSGLPRGLDPAVVTAAVAAVMPQTYDLAYLTKKAGTEYDAAIVAGVRAHRERRGVEHVLEAALVAMLTEHASVPIAAANKMLLDAERAVGRDYETNTPSDRSPAVLERVRAAMQPWFAPGVVIHTLALAREGMPPKPWAGSGEGANPPQSDEEWALFIACALHPSDDARALIAERATLIPRLDEPGRSAVADVLLHAAALHR